MSSYPELVTKLNDEDRRVRLESLKKLALIVKKGEITKPERGNDVNNHIHTVYSFSPYTPTKAVWMAYNAGLTTAGIMDHDSISGAREFIAAGEIIGLATTIGAECRVDFSKTRLKGRRINNPDQISNAYVAIHGIPHTKIDEVKDFFAPYQKERNRRNRLMVERINSIFSPFAIELNFDEDVVPLSKINEGGSITERHILYALGLKMMEVFGKGERLVNFLEEKLSLELRPKIKGYLSDPDNEYYAYDLLGALKSDLVETFYIEAGAECPDVRDFIAFTERIGAISAYAYLGDVGESVTGDKKRQKFEDDYLDLLFGVLKELRFNAVTYMPSRNTPAQLTRVKTLCEKYGFFQISGEDINSPRQPFVCQALRDEKFKNLIDSTWALIGHERAATEDPNKGLFSREVVAKYPDLNERIAVFKEIGKKSF